MIVIKLRLYLVVGIAQKNENVEGYKALESIEN
jgi:hypothetical protein